MPFEKPALSKKEISLFTRWIDQGAKWGTHWAYIPPKNEKIPNFEKDIFDVNFFDNSKDNFIAARMSEKKLSPNSESNKSVLARKVSLDISGLPPEKRLFKLFLENLKRINLVNTEFNVAFIETLTKFKPLEKVHLFQESRNLIAKDILPNDKLDLFDFGDYKLEDL